MFVGAVIMFCAELIDALLIAADVERNILVNHVIHFLFGFIKPLILKRSVCLLCRCGKAIWWM